jgi:hypothetical protein
LFGKKDSEKPKWKAEYDDQLYKIYDWNSSLTGYFFPDYNLNNKQEDETVYQIVEDLIKIHACVSGATLLVPMVKLDILDNHEGMDIDYVLSLLDLSRQQVERWKNWIQSNANIFGIEGTAVYTAREDRNMLSIALKIVATIQLGEKEVCNYLSPLLDKLHEDNLL